MLNIFGRRLRYGISVAALMAGTQAALLLNAYGGEGMAMVFSGAEPSIKIVDSTTPSNDWDSAWGDGYSVKDFFKTRSFTSYTGPVSSGKRLMQADGYIKPCRHNLLALSERLYVSSKYTATALAVAASSVSDPFGGTSSAAIITEDTSTGGHILGQSATVVAGLTYNGSIYVKAGTSDYVILAFGGASFTTSSFGVNLATGAATGGDTGSGADKTITSVGNGWYRISMSVVATASGSGTLNIYMSTDGTWANRSFTGTSRTIYSTGWQLNSGSSALDYVSSQAHNLILQSQTLDNASWLTTGSSTSVTANATASPDGTTTADLVYQTSGSIANRYQNVTVPASSTISSSFYFKASGKNYAYIQINGLIGGTFTASFVTFDLSAGTIGTITALTNGGLPNAVAGITDVGNGWYRCYFSAGVGTSNTAAAVYMGGCNAANSRSGTASVTDGIYVFGAQVELSSAPGKYVATTTTAVYNPHFDVPVEYNTNGTVKALTLEEARTNLALYSNNFSSTWSNANSSDLQSVANGPDGIASANSLTEDATAGVTHRIFQGVTIVSATTYCFSIYAREPSSNSRRYFTLSLNTQANGSEWFSAMFDLQGATVTTSGTGTSGTYTSSGMEAIGNGWYRCYVVGSLPTTSAYALVSLADGGTLTSFNRGSDVYNGDGASNLYFWGAQLEAGSTASSLIVTGSAAVTRAADDIKWSSPIMPHSQSVGTLYTKFASTQPNIVIWSLDDNTNNERFQFAPAPTDAVVYISDGGVTQSVIENIDATLQSGNSQKHAFAYELNNCAAALNGSSAVADDGSTTMPTTNILRLGSGVSLATPVNGTYTEFMYIPSRLANATLTTLTTA